MYDARKYDSLILYLSNIFGKCLAVVVVRLSRNCHVGTFCSSVKEVHIRVVAA